MWILLVEDDSKQAELITKALVAQHPQIEVRREATESGFRRLVPQLRDDCPGLIILDVMLRWCDVGPEMPDQPAECEDFSLAGIRCFELLKADPRLANIPVMFLTVLERNGIGLPPGCSHALKTADFKDLLAFVKSHIQRTQQAHR